MASKDIQIERLRNLMESNESDEPNTRTVPAYVHLAVELFLDSHHPPGDQATQRRYYKLIYSRLAAKKAVDTAFITRMILEDNPKWNRTC